MTDYETTWRVKYSDNGVAYMYKGDRYYGLATDIASAEEMIEAMNRRDIADTMGDASNLPDDTRLLDMLRCRITTLEVAQFNAAEIMESLGSLVQSQQTELNILTTRMDVQGQCGKSRIEVESQ